ncbi:hypothetical protein GQX74_009716 [Glossina fuscipes]|nr:hypothetical protein GQX74_009716 [Glossina fuscipes]
MMRTYDSAVNAPHHKLMAAATKLYQLKFLLVSHAQYSVALEDCVLLKGAKPANLNVSSTANEEVETSSVACRQSPLAPVLIVIPAVQKEGTQDKEQQVFASIDLLTVDLVELISPKPPISLSSCGGTWTAEYGTAVWKEIEIPKYRPNENLSEATLEELLKNINNKIEETKIEWMINYQ